MSSLWDSVNSRTLPRTSVLGYSCSDLRGCDFLRFFLLLQLRDDAEVFEGGHVAFDFAIGGEFAEQATHDFSAASFWQRVGEADVVGLGE